jgi:ribonucleoside-diphosphate reductase alpha chain
MKVSKQGSTLAGIMDAFSISVSLGLQHGVPLATYVRKYTNMRFEPAGITDDADLRIATSLVDYIFRRLAVDYLPMAERAELGVLSTAERMQPTLPGVEETATESKGISGMDAEDPLTSFVVEGSAPDPLGTQSTAPGSPSSAVSAGSGATAGIASGQPISRMEPRDAPYCYQCGNVMQRAGSCYVCGSCGTTSGCS